MNNRWLILAVLFLARTAMGYQFQSVGAVSPVLVPTLGIDYAMLGTLIGLFMLPGVVVSLPSGLLAARFGDKAIALVGLAMMALGGVVMAATNDLVVLSAGRLLTGIGGVLLNVVLTKMVIDWFAGGEIVTAMAILVTSWPLGIGLALLSLGALAEATTLAHAFLVPAAVCALAAILVGLTYRSPPDGAAAAVDPAAGRGRLSARELWLVSLAGLVWTTYNAGYIIVLSFAPELLTSQGVSVALAGLLVSLITWALVPVIPIVGYLADRLGRPTAVMALSFALTTAVIVAVPFIDAPVPLFILMGLVFSPPAGIIMALPAETVRPERRAVAMGVFYTWYYAGMATLPALAGFARDATGNAGAPVLVGGAVMGATLVVLVILRMSQRIGARAG